MATIKQLVHLDLNKNELQNVKGQNLATTPADVQESQFWYDTANHTMKFYNGSEAVDMGSQGRIYTEGAGIDITNDVISADLSESDIPSLHLSKITDVTASAAEVNVLDGITASTTELNYVDGVTSSIQNQLDSKIGLSSLSIDSGSTNYLGYDNSNGKISAKVDTTVTNASSKLITSGAVKTAIDSALTGALVYQGAWTATGQTDYSSITLPVKKGYMYAVSGSATVLGVEWNAGDYLVINKDIAVGSAITATDVDKIDNTEGTDIVRLNATQTLTNKTIDADDNTISDLVIGNFKSGVIVTTVGSTGSDSAIPTEKAVRSAITNSTSGFITASSTNTLTNKTIDADDNTISDLTTSNFKSGTIVTSVDSSSTDSALPTAKAVNSAIANAVSGFATVATETNPALTASGGVCTWTCSGSYASKPIVNVYDSSSNVVICDVSHASNTVTIKINSASNISANTYTAVIIY